MYADRENFRLYVNKCIDEMPDTLPHCTDYLILLRDKTAWLVNHIRCARENACKILEGGSDGKQDDIVAR